MIAIPLSWNFQFNRNLSLQIVIKFENVLRDTYIRIFHEKMFKYFCEPVYTYA